MCEQRIAAAEKTRLFAHRVSARPDFITEPNSPLNPPLKNNLYKSEAQREEKNQKLLFAPLLARLNQQAG